MITMIAAMDREGGIGYQGGLPWPRIPAEMAHFKQAIQGADRVMAGSYTWAGLPFKLQRQAWCISRELVTLDASTIQAITDDVWVIGGAQMYNLFLPFADRLVLSYIDGSFPADTYFPRAEFRADAPFPFHDYSQWRSNPLSPFPNGWQVCQKSGYRFWVDDLIRLDG